MKILSVIGARPEFVKEGPLSRELRKRHTEIIIHTGQHYDYEMSKVFFGDLKIPEPDYNLEVGSGTHGKQTGEMLIKLEEVFLKEKPDIVIVAGDTNTTIAGALSASKLGIKIAHVESGMRSFDKTMPEEINRVLTDHISNILFCSTETAVLNLRKESINENVFNVGDIMIDAIKENIGIAEKKSTILKKLGLKSKSYIIATVHRASNTDNKENLGSIIGALAQSKEKIVFPLHPRTEKYLKSYGLFNKLKSSNITITKPLGYLDMLVLEKNSRKILTDSGGIQKEAYFFGVPCITFRDTTEWVETVENGYNKLVGTDARKISDAIKSFEGNKKSIQLYGNGDAGRKIVEIISKQS